MLTYLHVKNLALIDEAEVEFGPGLNILTGETGAGGKESADPYNCKACGWAVYGLLGDLGKGVFVYVKEKLRGDNIFMPIAWEEEKE